MRLIALTGSVFGVAITLGGCALVPDSGARRLTGVSGPVEWEVIDVGRVDSSNGMRSRWSYTIVLKEKAGSPIQFERIDRSARASNLETGGIGRTSFDRRLDANSELRFHTVDTWGWVSHGPQFGGSAALGSLTVESRFVGKDSRGQIVVVPVRVIIDRGFGRPSRQPRSKEAPVLPARSLQAGDINTLAGRWEGYFNVPDFQVPIEAVVSESGAVEVGENDPVTNRFRGSLSIRDGRVWYSGRDAGEFVLHEGVGRRVLVGHLTSPVTGGAPAWSTPMRLEWVQP